jgi:phosphoribosylanthranilate isomerase
MRTRVKICGFTRPEHARQAAELGVDAIGLVFYSLSPRAVAVAQAQEIVAALPPFVCVVGLFVDAEAQAVRHILASVRIDLLQFHGSESPAECGQYGKPYIKTVRMRPGIDLMQQAHAYPDALGLLLDSYEVGRPGGTGAVFDWSRAQAHLGKPVILAGGLGPDNVATAIRQLHPYAVDVSSGVEAAKGIKDYAKMAALLEQVRAAG